MPAQVITTLTQLRAVKDEHFVEAFMNHLRLAFDHLRGQKPPTLVARTTLSQANQGRVIVASEARDPI